MAVKVGQKVIVSRPRYGCEWLKGVKSEVVHVSTNKLFVIPLIELECGYYVFEDEIRPLSD